MSHVPRALGKGVVKLIAVMNAVATGWIFVIMLTMVADVAGRALFDHPLTGTPELVKLSLVGIVFLQLPHTFWVGRHIRSEVVLSRLKPPYREVLEALAVLMVALVFWGIFYSSWGRTVNSWRLLEFEGEGALRVPVYPIRTIILLGSLLTAGLFTFRFGEALAGLLKGRGRGHG